MSKEKAIEILEHALNGAVQKGAYNLNDVAIILEAIKTIKLSIEEVKK
jgi:20S proteasome alpha/beta subunit